MPGMLVDMIADERLGLRDLLLHKSELGAPLSRHRLRSVRRRQSVAHPLLFPLEVVQMAHQSPQFLHLRRGGVQAGGCWVRQ